jgi:dephospho-CoA kinase
MNILIIGHARHGKDTVAEMISNITGYKFESSSMAAARIFIFDFLKEKYGYKNFSECFEDRVNRRKEWHDLICEFNNEDKSSLAKEIMKESNIYVGMRSDQECDKCLQDKVFDVVLGVFDPRKPLESKESFNIDIWNKSDLVIINNGTLEDLSKKVKMIFK